MRRIDNETGKETEKKTETETNIREGGRESEGQLATIYI